jgi:hypothetical protein
VFHPAHVVDFLRRDGTCPACGGAVTMYDWRIEPFAHTTPFACHSGSSAMPRLPVMFAV